MRPLRIQVLGPLHPGPGSRAVLGLAIHPDGKVEPSVLIWVPDEAQGDAPLLARIRREVERAAILDHPNIVRVLGYSAVDGRQARVVEFADGEPLRKVLETAKTLPARIAARIVCEACTGTHYAHLAGNDDGTPLVHGDLRPETLLISFSGTTKVTGYGALAFAPRDAGGQRVGGRRAYSAPEQIIGGREAFTIPTDVYLLGLTLYECLTGIIPWADQADFFDQAVLTHPVPPAPPGSIDPELEKVIARACAKKAQERFPTALALREAVERAVGSNLASNEEVALCLAEHFPATDPLRADRRRVIDAGLEAYRQQREFEEHEVKAAKPTAPIPPSESPAPAPAPPPRAKQAKAKRPTRAARQPLLHSASQTGDDSDPPPKKSTSPVWLLVGALVVAAAGAWWAIETANRPILIKHVEPTEQRFVKLDPARLPDPTPDALALRTEGSDAAVVFSALDASTPDPTRTAGAAASSAPDASSAGPRAPDETAVVEAPPVDASIDSRPEVSLSIDGAAVGKTPWRGRLAPGKHTLRLENRELGIATQRVIRVKGDGPFEETLVIEQGFVAVDAPEGAQVFIDGVLKGLAPISGRIPVYQGFHRIDVKVGQAKWGQNFRVEKGQQLQFNVQVE